MELNYNSTSSKLYRWFYDRHSMPETLCPYFWSLVFAWTLVVILSPLLLPTWIVNRFSKGNENIPTGPYALMGLLIYAAIFAVIGVGVFISSYWITYYQQTLGYSFYVAGGVGTFVGLIGLITWSIMKLKDRIRDRKYDQTVWSDELDMYIPNPHYRESRPNLFVEFIKAKYNKYCPKIDWK